MILSLRKNLPLFLKNIGLATKCLGKRRRTVSEISWIAA